MVYGFGRGSGRRGGAGFGFRGATPPWPYVGRGRGGLPRCRYPGLLGKRTVNATPRVASYQPSREDELGFLKEQTNTMKRGMEEIELRIQELEKQD